MMIQDTKAATRVLYAALCVAALLGEARAVAAAEPAAAKESASPVDIVRNQSYYDGADRDPAKHKLDLYLPKGVEKFPIVVFAHGGGWTLGSKDGFLGLPGHKPADHGRFFAEHGIGAVFINYRLSPKAHHPDHATDVARAVAWTRRHVGEFGGDIDRIFLMGHSAGGHLVALVASDPSYLMAEGMTPSMIRGVIPISGVFTLHADLTPAGSAPKELKGSTPAFLKHVFGENAEVYKQASPVAHVHKDMPPFLIAYADRDLPTLPAQAVMFQEALAAQGNSARKLLVSNRTHQGVLFQMIKPDDPLGAAVLRFVKTGKP